MTNQIHPSNFSVRLKSGILQVRVERADLPLDELCGFASRRSRKRGFVFVSKVLGKHYPVRPRTMALVHARLAARLLKLPGPVLFIAMAETATALGQGIYEAWLVQSDRDDGLFLHTTRYRLSRPIALRSDESHSHATEHLLYEPADPEDASRFHAARTLVLVDDEISTGRTLAKLAGAYRRLNPQLESVHLVCLTDWLGEEGRLRVAREVEAPTTVQSLFAGSFEFMDDIGFDPGPIPDVTGRGDLKDAWLRTNHGRLGIRRRLDIDLDTLLRAAGVRRGERLLVLGTGEFAYPPYVLARHLEELGWDVHFQSTTRSPLLVDGDITSSLEFVDNYHDQIPNYVYNVADRRYDRILVGYETRPLPAAHTLLDLLRGNAIYF